MNTTKIARVFKKGKPHVSEKGKQSLRNVPVHIAKTIRLHILKSEYQRIIKGLLNGLKSELSADAYQQVMEEIMHPQPTIKKSASSSPKNSKAKPKDDKYFLLSKTKDDGAHSVFTGSATVSGQPTTITAKITQEQIDFLNGKPMPKGRNLSLAQKKRRAASLASSTL